jgi:hypothetical protein
MVGVLHVALAHASRTTLLGGLFLVELLVAVSLYDVMRHSEAAFEATRTNRRAWCAALLLGLVVAPFGLLVVIVWLIYRPIVRRAHRLEGLSGVGVRRV